jgi:carboxylesterase type B
VAGALATRPGGPSGDYRLMDRQAALGWVQRSIRESGGDPDNVTIAGQSAGGLSVLMHLVSRGSRGLFDSAVVQSGSFALTQQPLETAETFGAAAAGCPDQTAACRRGLPNAPIQVPLSPDQETLAATMRAAWATFAATGDPSTDAVPWPSLDANRYGLSLVAPQPRLDTAFASRHHYSCWAAG